MSHLRDIQKLRQSRNPQTNNQIYSHRLSQATDIYNINFDKYTNESDTNTQHPNKNQPLMDNHHHHQYNNPHVNYGQNNMK
jgi:hypothetical protein